MIRRTPVYPCARCQYMSAVIDEDGLCPVCALNKKSRLPFGLRSIALLTGMYVTAWFGLTHTTPGSYVPIICSVVFGSFAYLLFKALTED